MTEKIVFILIICIHIDYLYSLIIDYWIICIHIDYFVHLVFMYFVPTTRGIRRFPISGIRFLLNKEKMFS